MDHLLEKWEDSARTGQELSPSELCPGEAELENELSHLIGVLRRIALLAGSLEGTGHA
jgi:hypothetical protein